MENPVIYTYRYMWRLKSESFDSEFKDKICIKIITDTLEGLATFEKSLIDTLGDSLLAFGKEYLHEYDVSLLGIYVPIVELKSEVIENEKV